jgi:hypothetical protein
VQEPPDVGWFHVDATTGAPAPLELVMSKKHTIGRSFSCYLPGAESTVRFPAGSQTFVAYRWAELDAVRKGAATALERLVVQDGKRFGTGDFVPLDVTPQGERVFGVFAYKNRKDPGRQTYVFRSRTPLPPGAYAFSFGSGITNATQCGLRADAFSLMR